MARAPKLIDPMDDGQIDPDEPTDVEMEQAAAGDITLLGDPAFNDYHWSIWRQRTRAEIAGDPRAPLWEFITKAVGPIEATSMVPELGGGVFEFRGFVDVGDGRGKRMKRHPVIALAGPRKNFGIETPSPAAITAPTNGNGTDPNLLRFLDRMELRLENLERNRSQVITSPPGPSIKELAETMVMLQAMTQKGQPASDTSVAKQLFDTMMAATKTGIELGQGREPVPAEEVNTTVKVMETIAPLASRFLDVLAASRQRVATPPPPRTDPAPGPSAPPSPPEPSSAEVVGQDPEEIPPIATARMMVVIDTLAMGAENRDDVEEVADLVAELLPPSDLAGILSLPDQVVVSDIAHRSGGQYPILATDAGRNYVAAILAELRRPPEPDDQP